MDDDVDLISEEVLAAANAYHVDVARVARYDRVLGDAALLERDALLAGEERGAHLAALLADRAGIVARLNDHPMTRNPIDAIPPAWKPTLTDDIIAALTDGWWRLKVPYMREGICQAPDTPSSYGAIETQYLGPGTVAFAGTPTQQGATDPHREEYWVCNWKCTVVFPKAPADGFLSYRFGIDATLTPYHATALYGGIYAWISIGTSGDMTQPITNWGEAMPWPVDVTLPLAPGQSHFFGRDVPVSGIISVEKNATAVLGIVVGVIIGLASGTVHILPTASQFLTHKADPYTLPADMGKIEYFFGPRSIIGGDVWTLLVGP